jgi:hypothetical protein
LQSRLQLYTSEVQNDTAVAFAELVASMEEEHRALTRENSRLVEFLYERLREARATIAKLSAGEPVRGEEDVGTPQVLAGGENYSSRMPTQLGDISSTSLDPALVQPTTSTILNRAQSPEMVTQPVLVNIQVDESPVETSHEESTNTVARDTTSSMLKRKRKASKDPEKFKHECETCGERFTRSTTLREHQRSHNDERPFTCRKNACSKAFARTKDRNRHEELHVATRKYKCDLSELGFGGQCGREFTREDGLAAHWRTERGWKCLKPQLGEFVGMSFTSLDEEEYHCRLTSDACETHFTQFDDWEAHLTDPANKKCVAEWLIKSVLDDERSYETLSKSKRGLPTEKKTGDERHPEAQEVTSRSSSHHTIQSGQATPQTSFQHTENGAEAPLPDPFVGSKTAEYEQEVVASGSQDTLLSLGEPDTEFDPFHDWRLYNATYFKSDLPPSAQIAVDIKCARRPTNGYRIIVESFEQQLPETTWLSPVPGIHTGLQIMNFGGRENLEKAILQGKAVYVMYKPDRAQVKTFLIGTLHSSNGHWRIIPSSETTASAVPRPIHEIVEGQMSAGEQVVVARKSDRSIYCPEQSQVTEEVINHLRQPTDEPLPEQATHSSSLNFSKWTILGSGFTKNRWVIWVEVQCSDMEVNSESLHFRLGTLLSRVRVERCGISSSEHFVLTLQLKSSNVSSLHQRNKGDLVFCQSGGTIAAVLPIGALCWSEITKEWKWAKTFKV